jgi:hypothetical protein
MKATEIIDKFKNVLLSVEAEEETPVQEELSAEVTEEVVEEQVELAQEETVEENSAEELAEENEYEEEVVEEAPEDVYATKEELNKAVAEFKAMYEEIMETVGKEEASDVPADLSSDKVELSEETEEISHSPEAEVDSTKMHLYAQSQPMTTKQRVFNKLFNN